jgi:hypothetical protein
MFCTKCGNKLTEGAQFCTKCGTALNIPSILNTTSPTGAFGDSMPKQKFHTDINYKKIGYATAGIGCFLYILVFLASHDILPNGEWAIIVYIISFLAFFPIVIILIKNILYKITSILFLLSMILSNLTRQLHILPDGEWIDIVGVLACVAIIASTVFAIRKEIKNKNNL